MNAHTDGFGIGCDGLRERIGEWVKTRGEDFLCFTDHNVLQSNKNRWVDIAKKKDTGTDAYNKLKKRFPDWVEERKVKGRTEVRLRTFAEVSEKLAVPGEFLLIQGEEITDRFKNSPVHMNATNIQSLIPPLGGDSVYETMQNNVKDRKSVV